MLFALHSYKKTQQQVSYFIQVQNPYVIMVKAGVWLLNTGNYYLKNEPARDLPDTKRALLCAWMNP